MTFPEKDGVLSSVDWQLQTMTFTATAKTEELSFFAVGPSGAPPFGLIDGVQLYQNAPEPASLTMMAFGGLVLLGGARHRRRRK
jgi:hypothetical protein